MAKKILRQLLLAATFSIGLLGLMANPEDDSENFWIEFFITKAVCAAGWGSYALLVRTFEQIDKQNNIQQWKS